MGSLLLCVAALAPAATAAVPSDDTSLATVVDTPLRDTWCQDYWALDSPCEPVRSRVIANHTSPAPTLSLGDPSRPALVFLHGWPDTAAMWANQFAAFCDGPDATHYCLATTMTDFHPDFPMVSTAPDRWSRLGFQFEVARIAATIQATRLSNVTIVTHDSGCQVGWILAYKFPTLVGRIVALTIGNSKGSTPFGAGTPDWMLSYQSHNVHAFDIKNTTPGGGPAGETATWEKCWEYWWQWHGSVPSSCNGSVALGAACKASTYWWRELTFPGTNPDEWTADSTPAPVSQKILFFYPCQQPPCVKAGAFYSEEWLTKTVDKAVPIDAGHWMACTKGAAVISTTAAQVSVLKTWTKHHHLP